MHCFAVCWWVSFHDIEQHEDSTLDNNEIKLRYGKVETREDVKALVAKAIESARTMKQRVQYAAVGIMIFAAKSPVEATELANELVTELGQGVKAEGLVKFLVDKAGFRTDPSKETKGFVSVKSAEWIKANLEEAKKTPWWTYAPATPFKEFTLEQELRNLIKKAKGKVKHAEDKPEDADLVHVDMDMITVLEALIGGNPVEADGAIHLIERIAPIAKAA